MPDTEYMWHSVAEEYKQHQRKLAAKWLSDAPGNRNVLSEMMKYTWENFDRLEAVDLE